MGVGAEAIANASTHTITMADGTADEFRSTFLRLTGGGTACTVTLAPNTLSHTWIMRNETAAALTLTQGSGANVIIAAGQTKIVATDGGGSGAIVYEMDDLELAGNLLVGGTLGVTGVLTTTAATVFNGGFASNAASTISTADNGTQLTLISTDTDANAGPHLKLYRNATGADSDALGQVEFTGKDDAGNDFIYAQIEAYISDASNGSEDGYFEIFRGVGGTERVSGMILSPTDTVFNENSADVDFRVESNDNVNMLFVDGGESAVGIGTATQFDGTALVSPLTISSLSGGNVLETFRGSGSQFVLDMTTTGGTAFRSSGSSAYLAFYTNTTVGSSTEAMRILANGSVVIGGTTASVTSATTIDSTGGIRGVYESGVGGDTLLGAIGGVSNGYQMTCTSGNAITYKWHTGGNINAMNINSDGDVGIGLSNQNHRLQVTNSKANFALAALTSTSAAGTEYGPAVTLTNDPNDTQRYFFFFQGGSTGRAIIYSNGNIQNTNSSYGGISDLKLKENSWVEATAPWLAICASMEKEKRERRRGERDNREEGNASESGQEAEVT